MTKTDNHSNPTSDIKWYHKPLIIILIPVLLVYYVIIRPVGIYFKELIAEQSRDIRPREPIKKQPNGKKAFIVNAAVVLTIATMHFLRRYRLIVAVLFALWLIYDIGLMSAIYCIIIWAIVWYLFSGLKEFRKVLHCLLV